MGSLLGCIRFLSSEGLLVWRLAKHAKRQQAEVGGQSFGLHSLSEQ